MHKFNNEQELGKELRMAASQGLAEKVTTILNQYPYLVDKVGVSELTALHYACGYSKQTHAEHNKQGDYCRTICTLMFYYANATLKGGKDKKTAIEFASHDSFIQNLIKINQQLPDIMCYNTGKKQTDEDTKNNLDFRYETAMEATVYYEKIKNSINIAALLPYQTEPYVIASFGSGFCEEFFALKLLFDEWQLKFRYIGLDNNQEKMLTTISMSMAKAKKFEAVVIDATDIDAVKKALLPAHQVDMCIVRHPNYSSTDLAVPFDIMFKTIIPEIIKANGSIITSFYDDSEYRHFESIQLNLASSVYKSTKNEDLIITINPKYKLHDVRKNIDIIPDNYMVALHPKGYTPSNSIEQHFNPMTPSKTL